MSKNEVEKQLILEDLDKQISALTEKVGHSELYGYDLHALPASAKGQKIRERLLTKFLVANKYDLDASKEQLKKTLVWRKSFDPLAAGFKETHEAELDKLGVITETDGVVATWNLYGAVSNRAKLFAKLDAFIRWRVGLMERGIALLDFAAEDESQSCYMIQTHDYYDVSFFRLDSATKAASSKAIQLFQDYYPEFVSRKFFVNVPLLMAWMFSFAKAFMSSETAAKLTMLSNGKDLAKELGNWVPAKYGGKGELSAIQVTKFAEPEIWAITDKAEQSGSAPEPTATASAPAAAPVPTPTAESVSTEPIPPTTETESKATDAKEDVDEVKEKVTAAAAEPVTKVEE